jgi:hypothetical protein
VRLDLVVWPTGMLAVEAGRDGFAGVAAVHERVVA